MNNKRVELSVHTNMSMFDSVNTAIDYIDEAIKDWQPAVAITDIDSVQAFPEAYSCAFRDGGIKLIYGCEMHSEAEYPFYVLVKNKRGLKELYELISKAFDNNKIPTVSIDKIKRENLILGTSIMSELIDKIMHGADDKETESVIKKFDYVLFNPTEYFSLYAKGKINNKAKAIEITKRIIALCEKNNVLPIASDEAYFTFSEDGECRKILLDDKGIENCDEQPNLYFRTTDEMLAEFDYLGKEKAFEIVVTNSNLIADMTDDTFAPFDTDAEYPNDIENLAEMTYNSAYKKYGEPLPDVIKARIEKELNIIGGNSKSVMSFILAKEIAANAKEKGYYIGFRGAVGSSLVANLIGITSINPLDAHYFCESCKYIEFHNEENCGADLPDKVCPKCGKRLVKDGYSLPEEVYIGYDSERELCIDLNLPEEILGESKEIIKCTSKSEVIDCGLTEKMSYESAYTIVHKYADKRKLKFDDMREIEYCDKLNESKSGMCSYPGVLVLPQNKDICDYTPVQYPTDGTNRKVTHFEYNYLQDILLKMNLLTHNSFSMLYKLENATGIKAYEIPLDDKETMEIIKRCDIDGIWEFEYEAAKEMIKKIKPQKFDDLIKISGLLHGTGIWTDNGEELFDAGIDFSKLPAFRDDIMLTLMKYGVERKKAFMISERVRKGRGLKEDEYDELCNMNVPRWFLNLCDSVGYLFPKAHAADYVRTAFILAYYKAHFRTEFERIAKEYTEDDKEGAEE